jgi:hypothetical protein
MQYSVCVKYIEAILTNHIFGANILSAQLERV